MVKHGSRGIMRLYKVGFPYPEASSFVYQLQLTFSLSFDLFDIAGVFP